MTLKCIIIIILSITIGVKSQSWCEHSFNRYTNSSSLNQPCNQQSGPYCQIGLICNSSNICVYGGKIGATCDNKNSLCTPPLECSGGVCIEVQFAGAGEPCSLATDCAIELLCIKGLCTLNSTTCRFNTSCDYKNYCSNYHNCQPLISLGDVCYGDVQCPHRSACDNACTAYFSLPFNATCQYPTKLSQETCDLGQGLRCNGVGGNEFNLFGVCVKVPIQYSPPTANCSLGNVTCLNIEEKCMCETDQCSPVFPLATLTSLNTCKTAALSYYKCLDDNKCVETTSSPSACMNKKCGVQRCTMVATCPNNDNYWQYTPTTQPIDTFCAGLLNNFVLPSTTTASSTSSPTSSSSSPTSTTTTTSTPAGSGKNSNSTTGDATSSKKTTIPTILILLSLLIL